MSTLQMISQILGSFGLFFFGLKLISEGVQSLFEKRIKYLMDRESSGNFGAARSIFVGLASVNVRSARFMGMGLLNAGLLPFKDMLTFFLGTAVGGSFVFWILIFGLEQQALNISAVGMLLLLLKVPFVFKDIGRLLIGVGFILLGQGVIGQFELHYVLGPISDWSASVQLSILFILGLLSHFILNIPYLVLFLILLVTGTKEMILPVHGLAMILGHLIGDSLTLFLSLKKAHLYVKRAALGNVLISSIFSVVGLILSITFYQELESFLSKVGLSSPVLFSILCTLMMIIFYGFVKKVQGITDGIYPFDSPKGPPPRLIFFGAGGDVSAALSLMQLELELLKFKNIVDRMFTLCHEYIVEENSPRALAKLKNYESVTDNIHREITTFVCKLSQSSLSLKQAKSSQAAFRISSELEKIADYIDKLATYKTRLTEEQKISKQAQEEILAFFEQITTFYRSATEGLLAKKTNLDDKKIEQEAYSLKKQAEQIRAAHIQRVESGDCLFASSLVFSDMVVALRKIRGHAHNIIQAYMTKNTFD